MNLKTIHEMQETLDRDIEKRLAKETNGEFDLLDGLIVEKRRFAFHVELAEFANEVGFFKYWKLNHKYDESKALEEFVDCVHFLASLGVSYRWSKFIAEVDAVDYWAVCPIEELFYQLRQNQIDSSGQYIQAFRLLLGIARKLDWNDDLIIGAYMQKNAKNYRRIAEGY